MHVINFDLPSADHDGKNEYVHRIGMLPATEHLRPLLTMTNQVALPALATKVLQRPSTTRKTNLLVLF